MREYPHSRATVESVKLTELDSIEHNDVEIVAVNDPFIEPHYAVSSPRLADSNSIHRHQCPNSSRDVIFQKSQRHD